MEEPFTPDRKQALRRRVANLSIISQNLITCNLSKWWVDTEMTALADPGVKPTNFGIHDAVATDM
jgi:hypothetical protein